MGGGGGGASVSYRSINWHWDFNEHKVVLVYPVIVNLFPALVCAKVLPMCCKDVT